MGCRPYTGSRRTDENAQSRSTGLRAPADSDDRRELYLPRCWTTTPSGGGSEPGCPTASTFEKPRCDGISPALCTQESRRWVAGDEVSGNDPAWRGVDPRSVRAGIGCTARPHPAGPGRARYRRWLPAAWQQPRRIGAKGERLSNGGIPHPDKTPLGVGGYVRSPPHGELGFYRCYTPQIVPLRERVRGRRPPLTIEESFQRARPGVIDEHQVADGLVAALDAADKARHAMCLIAATSTRPPAPSNDPVELHEIRRLLTLRSSPPPSHGLPKRLSNWRRRHQPVPNHHYNVRSSSTKA